VDRRPYSWLLAAALGAACGRDAGPSATDAAPSLVPAPLPPSPMSLPSPSCSPYSLPLGYEARAADILVLFDRSSSMTTAFGAGTRYSVEAGLLSDLVGVYQDKLRFGFQPFPAKSPCAGHAPGCCVEPPAVPVGPDQGDAVADAVGGAAPVSGATPTPEALRLAGAYFAALGDGVTGRYVLLSTDGHPSCGADGRLAQPDVRDANGAWVAGACHDALVEVEALVAAGVKVIVLGIGGPSAGGPGETAGCLEALAVAGGMPRADGRPSFYPAADPEGLEAALQQIFGGVSRPPCDLTLNVTPADPDRVAVFLDGREIPRDASQGWSFAGADPRHIVINGEYCKRLQRFQVTSIVVRGGCAPCGVNAQGEERRCE
jgi:hypothetical protein